MDNNQINQYGFKTIQPAFDHNNIPVVFATDNNYVPYLAVAIESLIENSTFENNYDIIILASKVNGNNKKRIERMADKYDNISIRWYNISEAVKNYKFANCSYYTDAIYYRIFMPYIMVNFDKMVYLDCDLIVVDDIAQLYNTEIGDNYLGVVKDIGMIIYKYNTSELQYLPDQYFEKALPNVNIDEYFNSGVLLMNLEAFRRDFSLEYLIKETNNSYYLYPDQDGLNNISRSNKFMLDMGWNTMPYNLGTRSREYIDRYLPETIRQEYDEARVSPHIIHYNMLEKPWLHPCWLDHELMVQFWHYAKNSPFFRDLILLKPTAFYNGKHRQKIPYYERQAVVMQEGKGAPSYKHTNNDVFFCAGKYLVANLSSIPIKLETIDFKHSGIKIYATFSFGDFERERLSAIYFADKKGKRYGCLIEKKGKPYLFGEQAIGQEYVISAKIPSSVKNAELKLFFVFDGVHIQMKWFNFSINFPIDRINRAQYFFENDYILTYRNATLFIKKVGLKQRIKYELSYEKSLRKRHKKSALIAAFARIPLMIFKKFRRRPVWIIGCNYLAADNGFAFFRFMQSKKKEIKTYFAVNDLQGEAAQKAKKVGKVVDKYSRKFQWLMLTSEASISSVADLRLIRPFAHNDYFRDILARRKFVFLQHGVTTQDQSREHNRFVYNPALFCTCAKQEYEEIKKDNYFYDDQVKLVGFPRFDYLYHDEKKIITIMPTWRKYYNGDYGIHTRFYNFYFTLLHDERLQNALKIYGYKLAFKPHPTVLQKTDLSIYKTDIDDNCFEFDQKSYAETYAESSLILTDYSSAVFDFLYLRKPVIYTQFDSDEFFSGKHVYEKGYIDYEKNGFGEVEYTVNDTVDRIIEYMQNDCKMKDIYKERVDSFFAFDDKNNGERVYQAIKELTKK